MYYSGKKYELLVWSSVILVDVLAKLIGFAEFLVTFRTGVVVKCHVLGDTGCTLELCVAGGTCVCHYVIILAATW